MKDLVTYLPFAVKPIAIEPPSYFKTDDPEPDRMSYEELNRHITQLRASGLKSAKGGIVETAVIAGTMAVKRTHELIPFCHPLPIDGCTIAVEWSGTQALAITCTVKTTHRTGVEMEALTGATVAALTVYDMCKALSHAIVIGPARLVSKRGGKRDVGGGA